MIIILTPALPAVMKKLLKECEAGVGCTLITLCSCCGNFNISLEMMS
jgi:hypothetical protein